MQRRTLTLCKIGSFSSSSFSTGRRSANLIVSGIGLPGGDNNPANVTKPGFDGPAGEGVGLAPLAALTRVIVPPLPVNEVSID